MPVPSTPFSYSSVSADIVPYHKFFPDHLLKKNVKKFYKFLKRIPAINIQRCNGFHPVNAANFLFNKPPLSLKSHNAISIDTSFYFCFEPLHMIYLHPYTYWHRLYHLHLILKNPNTGFLPVWNIQSPVMSCTGFLFL